jgi:polar amino acid transport system substrate-binding protein
MFLAGCKLAGQIDIDHVELMQNALRRREVIKLGASAAIAWAIMPVEAERSRRKASTLKPGILIVASAYPDPPFDIVENGVRSGFDVQLMQAICVQIGLTLQTVRYPGADFNGIFDGLLNGTYDAVISGTTITPERSAMVRFSQPYLEFNQAVAVNRLVTPNVTSTADLHGLTAGIQSGNTSDIVAKRWLAAGTIGGIRYYPYDGIATALGDLKAGRIGLFIKLFPVISWLIKDYPKLTVAMQVPTNEALGIAFAKNCVALCNAVDSSLQTLRDNGKFAQLQARWFLDSPKR